MPTLGKTKVSPSLISTGSLFQGTSSYAVTASYAMNGGSGGSGGAVQTGSIANQTVLYNVTTSQDNVITGLNLSNNKWGISVVEEWNSASVPGEPYYNSCSLLLHFDGANGSTTFTDNSPTPKTVTSVNGAAISTAQSKFGGASLLLDGTDDYLSTNSTSAFDWQGDITIECWIYPLVLNGNNSTSYGVVGTHFNFSDQVTLIYIGGAGRIMIGKVGLNEISSTTGVISTSNWQHIAVVKSGSTTTIYVNGSSVASNTTSVWSTGTAPLYIGYINPSNGSYFNGYIDELRITKGVARYTGSFTTSSVAFPNAQETIPQYETKYIGLIGGLNDSTVDYGVEKLSDSSLKIRKMSASGQPLSGSGQLSASVDRVYVNVLNYDNVSISGSISNAISSSYSLTASYNLNSVSSSFANTSSYSLNTISSSYSNVANTATSATSATSANTATSSSYATVAGSATSATSANTANSATSASYSLSSSFATNAVTATSATSANSATSASYSLSSSYSVNSNTSISSSFSSTASYNLNSISSSFSTTSSYNLNSVSSSYALTASFALNSAGGGGTTLTTGSTYPITSSWAINAITASYALNASGGGSGGSTQTGSIANQTILYNVTTSQDNVITGLNLSSNKWGVTVVEEWNSGSIVGDEYYPSCSLLLHFDGTNGSTTFTDNSPSPKTVTSNNGAAISTVQSKFGGASALFDGTNDYLTLASDAAFGTGTGDFTIEFWMYPVSVASGWVFDNRTGGAAQSVIGYFSAAGSFTFTGGIITTGITKTSVTANSWYHIACVRSSGTAYLFVNGISAGTDTVVGSANSSNPFTIGSKYDGTNAFNGYIDDFRYTKGVARYTGSFTTSSVAFPNSVGVTQYATKYIGSIGGLNDSNVDYGVEKLSDGSLKIRKMTASGQPLSGSGTLSASVDRVYVNVLDYTNVMVTSSYALTASYVLGGIQTGSISNQTILYNVTTSQDNTITGLDLSGNKWDVSVIEEWDAKSITGGDQYYPSCSLLLHFSGSNGSTTFIDNSPSPKTVTSVNGTAISTAQSKFGGSSGLFDGTDDYLSVTNNSAFDFGAGDFTIEYWEYRTLSSTYSPILSRHSNMYAPYLLGWYDSSVAYLSLYMSSNGSSFDIASNVSMGTITTNVWTHYAVTRQGNTFRTFQNGIQISTFTSAATFPAGVGPLEIGRYEGTYYFKGGYIDELRITKGVARYTGSFVTQSTAFLDSQNLNQLQTKYIGLVGGINDSTVDYGVEKLSDSSLKIRKMSASGQPLSGSGALSASVDRVYVNVLNYKEVQTTAQSASYAVSSSYLINASAGESFHPFLLG